MEELRERPRAVNVRLLDSSTAAVSWAPSSEKHNGSMVSVASTTCLRPSLSQRMESTYCSEVTGPPHLRLSRVLSVPRAFNLLLRVMFQENSTSDIISHLTPGAQYRVLVYHTNGPLISPPSEPVIIDIGEE